MHAWLANYFPWILRKRYDQINPISSYIAFNLYHPLQKSDTYSYSFHFNTGRIPRELGLLRNLQHLDLSGNKLSGQRWVATTMHIVFHSLVYLVSYLSYSRTTFNPAQRFYNFDRHSDGKVNCEFIRDFYGMYLSSVEMLMHHGV